MKSILEMAFGICLAGLVIFGAVYYTGLTNHTGRVYNCSIAEISPDIPLEVKEACRKLNTERIK